MEIQPDVSISRNIVGFCRFLRANGLPVGITQTRDALQAARLVSITDRKGVKYGMRSIVCTSKEECEAFDRLFDIFWNPAIPPEAKTQHFRPVQSRKPTALEGRITRSALQEQHATPLETAEKTGASALERLKKTDFSRLQADDLSLLDEVAFRLWKQMSMRVMRRWRLHGRIGRLDLRRTIRRSIGRGGEPFDLLFREHKRKKIRLVTLLDVSGSMDLYSAFLLRFLYALHKYFRTIDSFVFSTRLTPVSRQLHGSDIQSVVHALSDFVQDWSGGTRIGECLKTFNIRYARRLLTRDTLVIILSDGWDTGNPQALAQELREIKRRVRKLIWLNPLLGLSDYQPLTGGMSAALPYADVFAPAHNLQTLLDLERHL